MPASVSFYVANSRAELRRLLHPDAFNSLYLQVEFPTNALASLSGTPLGPDDSVLVTLEPEPDGYGVTLRPSGLQFTSGRGPTASFVYAAYGDLSVAGDLGERRARPVAERARIGHRQRDRHGAPSRAGYVPGRCPSLSRPIPFPPSSGCRYIDRCKE
jgi:hypothetical protein